MRVSYLELIYTIIGIFVISLRDYYAADNSAVPFEKLVVHKGVPAGTIRGKISIAASSRKVGEKQPECA
jgi:hypothetical protein